MDFQTKDSGVRESFGSGMVRDTQAGKPRFDLLFPKDVPFSSQMITRAAALMERGMGKYGERNWELAKSDEELDRAKASALRHMAQWINGEDDEDHAAAVIFNVMQAETIRYKLDHAIGNNEPEQLTLDFDTRRKKGDKHRACSEFKPWLNPDLRYFEPDACWDCGWSERDHH